MKTPCGYISYILIMLLMAMVLSPSCRAQSTPSPWQVIIAIDESGSMVTNDSEGRRYTAMAIFSQLIRTLGRDQRIRLGIIPFANTVFGTNNGRVRLQPPRYINPQEIARRITGGNRNWTRIDRVLKAAYDEFSPGGNKTVILLSDGVDSLYIEPNYPTDLPIDDLQQAFQHYGRLIEGTDLYHIVHQCRERGIKIYSLIINSAFAGASIGQDAILGATLLNEISLQTGGLAQELQYNTIAHKIFNHFVQIAKREGFPIDKPNIDSSRTNKFQVMGKDSSVFLTTENGLRYIRLPNRKALIDLYHLGAQKRTTDDVEISSNQLSGLEGAHNQAVIFRRPSLEIIRNDPRRAGSWIGWWEIFDEHQEPMDYEKARIALIYDLALKKTIQPQYESEELVKLYLELEHGVITGNLWPDILNNSGIQTALTTSKTRPAFGSHDWKALTLHDGIIDGMVGPAYHVGEHHLHCLAYLTPDRRLIITADTCPITIVHTRHAVQDEMTDHTGITKKLLQDGQDSIRPDDVITIRSVFPEGAAYQTLESENARIIEDKMLTDNSYLFIAPKEGSPSIIEHYLYDQKEYRHKIPELKVKGRSVLEHPFVIKQNGIRLHVQSSLWTGTPYIFTAEATYDDSEEHEYQPREMIFETTDTVPITIPFSKDPINPRRWNAAYTFESEDRINCYYSYTDKAGHLYRIPMIMKLPIGYSRMRSEFAIKKNEFATREPILIDHTIEFEGGTTAEQNTMYTRIKQLLEQSDIYLQGKDNLKEIRRPKTDIVFDAGGRRFQIGFPSERQWPKAFNFIIDTKEGWPLPILNKNFTIKIIKFIPPPPFRIVLTVITLLICLSVLVTLAGLILLFQGKGMAKIDTNIDDQILSGNARIIYPRYFRKAFLCKVTPQEECVSKGIRAVNGSHRKLLRSKGPIFLSISLLQLACLSSIWFFSDFFFYHESFFWAITVVSITLAVVWFFYFSREYCFLPFYFLYRTVGHFVVAEPSRWFHLIKTTHNNAACLWGKWHPDIAVEDPNPPDNEDPNSPENNDNFYKCTDKDWTRSNGPPRCDFPKDNWKLIIGPTPIMGRDIIIDGCNVNIEPL